MSQSGTSVTNSGPTGYVQTINGAIPLAGNINLTSTGGTIIITPSAHTVNIESNGSGTVQVVQAGNNISITGNPAVSPVVNVAGTVNHSVLLGNGAGSITSLANGTTGQTLHAVTGSNNPIWSLVSLTSDISGILPIANGGTNASSFANVNGTTYFDGTRLVNTAVGTSGFVLTSNGASAPTYQAPPSSGITNINGDSGNVAPSAGSIDIISNVAVNNSGSSVSFSGSGSTLTLNLSDSNNNTYLGKSSGPSGFSSQNIAMGYLAFASASFPSNCIAIGISAGQFSGGSGNILIGSNSGQDCLGNNNVLIGASTGLFLASGSASSNVAIGSSSGSNWQVGTESNNIAISNIGGNGDGGVTRIGSNGSQTTAFIAGIRGVTTANNDAIAVLIDSAGQLGTVSSSARYKDNIEDMGEYSSIIMRLRPVVFNYKEHLPTLISVGLIAEEVDKIMPSLVVYKDGEPETVKYHDLVPMLLNELQELRKDFEEYKRRLL